MYRVVTIFSNTHNNLENKDRVTEILTSNGYYDSEIITDLRDITEFAESGYITTRMTLCREIAFAYLLKDRSFGLLKSCVIWDNLSIGVRIIDDRYASDFPAKFKRLSKEERELAEENIKQILHRTYIADYISVEILNSEIRIFIDHRMRTDVDYFHKFFLMLHALAGMLRRPEFADYLISGEYPYHLFNDFASNYIEKVTNSRISGRMMKRHEKATDSMESAILLMVMSDILRRNYQEDFYINIDYSEFSGPMSVIKNAGLLDLERFSNRIIKDFGVDFAETLLKLIKKTEKYSDELKTFKIALKEALYEAKEE